MKKILGLVLCFIGLSLMGQPAPVFNVQPVGGTFTGGGGGLLVTPSSGSSLSVTNFALSCITNIIVRTTANATAYTANDAICNSETATNLPTKLTSILPTLSGKITKVRMINSTNTAIGTFRVWFYTGTNITQQADNTVYTTYWTNGPTRLGSIDVQLNAGTDCAYGFNATDQLPVCSIDESLYYNVQTLSAFTPIGGMTNLVEVTVQPNK